MIFTKEQLESARLGAALIEDVDASAWWNDHRDSHCWSMAIQGFRWEALGEADKANLRRIYRTAGYVNGTGGRSPEGLVEFE